MNEECVNLLDRLFTCTFSIDKDLRLSNVSSRLGNLCAEARCGSNFLEVFRCHRPTGVASFEDFASADKSLFLLISADEKLALKGQMLPLDEGNAYQFVGMPWLAWMNEKASDVKLNLGDFPKLDSQMDQEFYLTSQQSMVRDLESLNEKLALAEEEALEANRVQSDLFAVMSHEMRTPLNGVISALSLLSGEKDPIERRKLTNIANESAGNLLSVINYALDYSKIDAGRMKLENKDFSIVTLLESVMTVVDGRAKEKSIQLAWTLDPETQSQVKGDEEKLRQVLINVVGNAIKYTELGAVTVRVEQDQNRFRFVVSDTGTGISKEDIERIFDPFWGKSKGTAEASTGLGLNIVKRLVELMSGEIHVDSTEGQGSTFSIDLPLQRSDVSAEKVSHSKMDAIPSCFSGRVLLVDDNQTNLMLGKMILEKHGLSVRTASNGKEAIDIIKDVTFHLVLMDISMPVMDGMAATREINRMKSPPPVVALTAYVGDAVADEYLESGFKGYLKKPLETEALLTELNLWLKPSELTISGSIGSGKVLNKHKVLEDLITQIGEDNFERVRSLFFEETERRLGSMLSAWVRRDLESVRKEAHTLASSVASFGCEDLSWRLRKIEEAASEDDATEIVKYMKDIESAAGEALQVVLNFTRTQEANYE